MKLITVLFSASRRDFLERAIRAYRCQPSIKLIIVLVNAVEQMSLELKLLLISGGMPVPCQWCRHGKTTLSKIRRSLDDDEVAAACGRSQSASGTDR